MTARIIAALILSVVFSLGADGQAKATEKALKIRNVYPVGEEVATNNRIYVEFNQNVLTLDASTLEDDGVPIVIEPAVDCEWSWVELDTLMCELPEDTGLHPATSYKVIVRPSIEFPSGHLLEREFVHTFKTTWPPIDFVRLMSWMSPTQPIIEVCFNHEINLDSLHDKIFLNDSSSSQSFPVRIWPRSWKLKNSLTSDYFGVLQNFSKFDHLDQRTNGSSTSECVLLVPREPLPPTMKVSLLLLPSVAENREDIPTTGHILVDTDVTTIGDFHLLGLDCQDVHDEKLFLKVDDPIDSTCSASSNFALVFSSPVELSVDRFIHTDPPLPRKNSDDRFNFGQFRRAMDSFHDKRFQLSFQREFKPSTNYRLYVVPSRQGQEDPKTSSPIQDAFGRYLVGTNQITFRTENASAATFLGGKFAVVVNSKGTVEPNLYTRNVEDIIIDYVILDEKGEQRNLTVSMPSSNLDDVLHSQKLGFRTKLRSSSGAMIGEISSKDRFDRQEERIQDSFFVQATPYSVFLKVRDFNVLVWVVDLQTGEPIEGATVQFFEGQPINYSDSLDPMLVAVTDENGLVSFQSPKAIDVHWSSDEEYFVRVEGEEGIALLPVDWYFELQDLYLPETVYDSVDHWSTTPQPIYEPGDTVQIKGFVRNKLDSTPVIQSDGNFALCVSTNGRQYEINEISLNQFGAYHTSLQLSEQTETGTYGMTLIFAPTQSMKAPCSYKYNEWNYDTPGVYVVDGGSFEVSEFDINPVQVSQVLSAHSFERGESMSILIQSEFHVGGPNSYGNGSIDVYLSPSPPPIEIVDIKQYEFSGLELEPSPTFWDSARIELDFELDKDGKFMMTIDPLDHGTYFGTYRIETLIGSNQGKTIAALDTADYYGVDQFVGIRQPVERAHIRYDRWSVTKLTVNQRWPIEVLVVSKDDEIVVGKDIQISIFSRGKELSYREYEWDLVSKCELVSELDPVACDFTPSDEGLYRIDAQIFDSKGYSHRSTVLAEAIADANREDVSDDLEDLVLNCDVNAVNVGDVVRCEVVNHLGGAPSLVTVEHDGVIDQWLVRLDPANPYFEFSVLKDYRPSFSLSVLSQSPRSPIVSPLDSLFRIETAKFTFKHPHPPSEQLEIEVSSDRAMYHPGDSGSITLSTTNERDNATPVEYTVAIIDKTILDYRSRRDRLKKFMSLPIHLETRLQERERTNETDTSYFDPTRTFWQSIENGANTYGLVASLMEQSDKRATTKESNNYKHLSYGSSAFGRYLRVGWDNDVWFTSLHEVKKWIAYWNPSVISPQGQTRLFFELPDRHTSWTVMVLAASVDGQFGFTTTTFESTKTLEVRAVQPRVVTEGDTFQVGVSIRNRTERKRATTVELNGSGTLAPESDTNLRQRVSLKPFETKSLTLNVRADDVPMKKKQATDSAEIRVLASVGNRKEKDELDLRIPVRRSRVLVSNVVYGSIENDNTSVPIELPSRPNIDEPQLDVTVTTGNTVNLDGVFRVVPENSFSHWEQKISKAVLAMQYLQLEGQDKTNGFQVSDAEQLIVQVLNSAFDYQTKNGGMAYSARWFDECPYLSTYTALAFGWLQDTGYDVPKTVNRKLNNYLRSFLSRREGFNSDYSSVRNDNVITQLSATNGAVALHALALAGELTETDLIAFSNRIEQLDLFGLSHYLLATLKLNSTYPLSTNIFERIMDHHSEADGSYEFVESVPHEFLVILHSESRSLCSVLEALTKYSQSNLSSIDMGQLRELSNTIRHARQNSPYWSNMQENVFCTNALISFFELNQSETSALETTIDLRSDEPNVSMRLADAWRLNKSKTGLHTSHVLGEHGFGPNSTLEITRTGKGGAFFDFELSYLTSVDQRVNRFSSYEVHREYVVLRDKQWLVLDPGDHVNTGELVLVNLYLNTKIDRHHILLEDSIPGGLEPVAIDDDGRGRESIFYFIPEFNENGPKSRWQEEFSEGAAWRRRWSGYSEIGTQNIVLFDDFMRRGKHQASWIGRAITAGEFTVLPAHVEEFYRPIMFGESEPWILIVKP